MHAFSDPHSCAFVVIDNSFPQIHEANLSCLELPYLLSCFGDAFSWFFAVAFRCPGFVLRANFLALGTERNEWNLYFTDGGDNYTDYSTEDRSFDSTVDFPGYYW